MAFKYKEETVLNKGVDLRALTHGVNLDPQMAEDAQDMLPRMDGPAFKTYGWKRKNTTALTGLPVGTHAFNYQGKNTTDVRTGNLGLANNGNNFTRRPDLWSGIIFLTESTFYFWNPATEAPVAVSLPAGVTVDIRGKPSMLTYNNNVYIVGWSTSNLRFDPTDRVLYVWGWEAVAVAPTIAASGAGGDLRVGGVYNYAYTFVDFYTGEESALGALSADFTATATGEATITFAHYTGSRHFNGAGTANDVGIAIYRTEADRATYNFLILLDPDDGVTTFVDTGLATDRSVQPFRGTMQDEPRFDAMVEYQDRFIAVSRTGFDPPAADGTLGRGASFARIYFNDFNVNSFVERWPLLNFRTVPLTEGESMTALDKTFTSVVVFSERRGYLFTLIGGEFRLDQLTWDVGCVGPKATDNNNGWIYWLSERGPVRWREGIGRPQDIGRRIESLFIDSTSNLCKLNPGTQQRSEVFYDPDSRMMRFIFPCGSPGNALNRHWGYWLEAERLYDDFTLGWFPQSPSAQAFEYSNGVAGLTVGGHAQSPVDSKELLVFLDDNGYIYTYDPAWQLGGADDGLLVASGTVVAGTATTVTTEGGLPTTGDGLAGLRVEIDDGSGDIQVRTILSNTASVITVDIDFVTTPTTAMEYYIAGIPAFFRTVPLFFGGPHHRTTILHLYVGNSIEFDNPGQVIDITHWVGDRANALLAPSRTATADLSDTGAKILISRMGLAHKFEFANSRPSEPFILSSWGVDAETIGVTRDE